MEEEDEGIPLIFRGMMSGSNIKLEIEYSDYAVGRTLQIITQDWVKSLSTKKVPKLIRFFESKSDFMHTFVPFIFSAASLYGLSKFPMQESISTAEKTLLVYLSISVMMFVFGRFLNTQFFRQVTFAKPLTFIKITKGDIDRSEKIAKRRARKAGLSVFFFGTIFIGIVINIFSSAIWDWYKL